MTWEMQSSLPHLTSRATLLSLLWEIKCDNEGGSAGNGEVLSKYKGLLLFTKTAESLNFWRTFDIPQQLSQINIIQTKHLILAMCNNSPSTEQTRLPLIPGARCQRCRKETKPFWHRPIIQASTRLFLFSQLKDLLQDASSTPTAKQTVDPTPQSFL